MIIFDSPGVQAIFRQGSSDHLLITFGTVAMLADGHNFFAKPIAEAGDLSAIGFMSKTRKWFPRQHMQPALAAVAPYLARFRERLVYGYSMGAYAALKYSRALGGSTVISVCPQYSINPADVDSYDRCYIADFEPELHDDMRISAGDHAGRTFIFYDSQFPADRQHVANIAAAIPATPLAMKYTGHETMRCLKGRRAILTLFDLCRRDDLPRLQGFLRERRKTDPIRALQLGLAILESKPRWAMAIQEKYTSQFLAADAHMFSMRCADRLAVAGRHDEALTCYQRAHELRPADPEPMAGIARAMAAQGSIMEAADWTTKAADAAPDEFHFAFAAAEAQLRAGQTEAAIRHAAEAHRLAPYQFAPLRLLIDAHQRRDEREIAANYIRRAAWVGAQNPELMEWSAHHLGQLGQLEEACLVLRDAIGRFPDHLLLRRKMAERLVQVGRIAEADGQVEDIIVRAANSFDDLEWATHFRLRINHDAALRPALAALALRPEAPAMLRLVTNLHARAQDWPAALAHAARCAETAPNDPDMREWLAELYLRGDALDTALEHAQATIALDPRRHGALRLMTDIHLRRQQPDLATATTLHAMTLDERNVVLIEWSAHAMLRAGRPALARLAAARALMLDPQRTAMIRLLADIDQRLGDADNAAILACQIGDSATASVDDLLWAGFKCLHALRFGDAERHARAAAARDPNSAAAHSLLQQTAAHAVITPPWIARQTPDERWELRSRQLRASLRRTAPTILFVGDSLTDHWAHAGQAVWQRVFAPLGAQQIGMSGETTQGLLWRIENGAVDDIAPDCLVLMIGTNNINHGPAADVARGIGAVLLALAQRLPRTQLVLLGLTPRGRTRNDVMRRRVTRINALLPEIAARHGAAYRDCGPALLDGDGELPEQLSPDALHFTEEGYRILAPLIVAALPPLRMEMQVAAE